MSAELLGSRRDLHPSTTEVDRSQASEAAGTQAGLGVGRRGDGGGAAVRRLLARPAVSLAKAGKERARGA
jgi:hypothetical protein